MKDEQGFLCDLLTHPDDATTRLIYADWLEEHDDAGRAEFLRLELRLTELPESAAEREATQVRLRQLCQAIPGDWLATLDRTHIENCLRFAYACPLRWESLQPTDRARVRFCASCHRAVHHCATVEEARVQAEQGHCVAVDSRLCRTEGDLTPADNFANIGIITMGRMDVTPPAQEGQLSRKHWWQFWKRSQ